MICSMCLDGSTVRMTIEGGHRYGGFPRLCLSLRKGDLVIMNKLSPHKSEPTLSLIAQAGAEVLGLLPGVHPIEQMWSKIKASLQRPGAHPARSDESDRFGFGASHPRMPGIGLPPVATVLFKSL
jgi:hypothetical protein